MFLPLNDSQPNRYQEISWMTMLLIMTNILFHFVNVLWLRQDDATAHASIHLLGFTPSMMLTRQGGGALMSLTAIFSHGSFIHLAGNMLFLWIFGRRVEDVCGSWRFLVFYLTCGVCADLATSLAEFGSPIPHIGASGAISGVMGAYLLLFPEGKIRVLVWLFGLPLFPSIRAVWLLLLWLAMQIIPALDVLLNNTPVSVGYWAHLGGFFGALLIFFYLRPEAFERYLSDLPVS